MKEIFQLKDVDRWTDYIAVIQLHANDTQEWIIRT
jgi:hypothetical protein